MAVFFIAAPFIRYFNPRSPRGLRRRWFTDTMLSRLISIHAAQEGCDGKERRAISWKISISIHAAQEGCDRRRKTNCNALKISIHAAQEGCDIIYKYFPTKILISIHAAQEGCDRTSSVSSIPSGNISIHAAQEGCDFNCCTL